MNKVGRKNGETQIQCFENRIFGLSLEIIV